MSEYHRATTVSSWSRRLAAGLAVAVAATAAGVMPAHAAVAQNASAPLTLVTPIDAGGYTPPTVSGEATVGHTLTVATGDWAPETTFEYQWLADGMPLDGATGSTLVLAPDHAGRVISAQVTGSQPGYTPETRTSARTNTVVYEVLPAGVAFADLDGTNNDTYTVPATDGVDYHIKGETVAAGTYPGTGTVTVTAAAKAGYVLAPDAAASWTVTFSSTPYSVSPAAVVFRDLLDTKGDTYTVPATTGVDYLVGGNVVAAGTYPGVGTVTVTAVAHTDYVIAPESASSWTATFQGALVGPAPRITGTAKVGYVLTAIPGAWSPAPDALRYQWYRSGVAVVGATAATYRLPASAAGATYAVRITASKTGSTTVVKASAATAVVAKGSLAGSVPRMTGTPKVGYVLTAIPGAWSPAPVTLRYQWFRSGVAVVGATAATYRLPASAAGARYSVRVTGSKTGYFSGVKASVATAAVAKGSLAGSVPRITGTTKVGYVLTAIPGAWSPAPVTLRYQWFRSGVAIAGATAATYRLTSSSGGKTLTVRVTGSKTGYFTGVKTSAATARIAVPYVPPAPVAVYYATCTEARDAGAAPLFVGEPGYRNALDRDSDGIACER